MGGHVGLESELGVGSRFFFVLTMKAAANQAVQVEDPLSALNEYTPEEVPAENLNVLLAEDNLINQVYARNVLDRMGATVTVANNGQEALDLVQKHDFDLVLMDCQMPTMDGYEATRAIRKLGNEYATLPVIALTAFAMAEDRDICIAAGMDDYVTKPVDRNILVKTIGKWVTKRKSPVRN